MPPKKIKICLAMGGGVSMGTLSGAALTESLKLLLYLMRKVCQLKLSLITQNLN